MSGISTLVTATGPDARSYLQGQLTQDLTTLGPHGSIETLVLHPKGTIAAAGVVHLRADDDLALEVPADTATACLERLARFLLRAKVDLGVGGPPSVPWRDFVDEAARLDAGVPAGAELAEELVPHALDGGLLERTVSFTKGCYPGQELVARMRARNASPPYVLRRGCLSGPASPGEPAGEERFEGRVTSVVELPDGRRRALLVLHRSDAARGHVEVRSAAGRLDAELD